MHVTGDLVRIRGGRGSRGNVVSNAQNALKLLNRILRTVYRPHERTLNPNGRAHRSMWRPCSPDGELGIGRHRPLRTPAENLAKTTSPLELTLGTFVIHTQTKPGSHGAVPGDLGGGPGGRRTAPTAEASAMRDPRGGKRVNREFSSYCHECARGASFSCQCCLSVGLAPSALGRPAPEGRGYRRSASAHNTTY